MRLRTVVLMSVVVFLAAACAPKVIVKDHHHGYGPDYVLVHKQPVKTRRCIKHKGHWHCRR